MNAKPSWTAWENSRLITTNMQSWSKTMPIEAWYKNMSNHWIGMTGLICHRNIFIWLADDVIPWVYEKPRCDFRSSLIGSWMQFDWAKHSFINLTRVKRAKTRRIWVSQIFSQYKLNARGSGFALWGFDNYYSRQNSKWLEIFNVKFIFVLQKVKMKYIISNCEIINSW
jgi:hypothetical protein